MGGWAQCSAAACAFLLSQVASYLWLNALVVFFVAGYQPLHTPRSFGVTFSPNIPEFGTCSSHSLPIFPLKFYMWKIWQITQHDMMPIFSDPKIEFTNQGLSSDL
jgi:hypothetical protein